MDDNSSAKVFVPAAIMQPLLDASNVSELDQALEFLIQTAKSADGRADFASKNMVNAVLQLCQVLEFPSNGDLLLSSLKVLRNLCAGEMRNQNSFLEQNGVGIISGVISSVKPSLECGCEIIRMCLQLLGNVALAGGEHQGAIWSEFFPHGFYKIAELRSRETCDPLCMVIYTCSGETDELLGQLCSSQGLHIITEVLSTVSIVGFSEDWFKLLLSRVCLDKSCFASIFSKLHPVSEVGDHADITAKSVHFSAEQAFLLRILSEILNERIEDVVISIDFSLCILEILRSAVEVVDSVPKGKSALPTGHTGIDVLGYSLTTLRDICACADLTGLEIEGSNRVVDMLVSSGLIDFLLSLLRDLEPPTIIKKAMRKDETSNEAGSYPLKQCPYKGFRRDIVAILGNCAYHRKRVQDEVREKNGILLLLQQCVLDEDNPFLREWGIWSVRNLLEGNAENQQVVADLEIQGSVDVPEMVNLGLRVEMDPQTRRAKLVNT
ncbi:ataxin-10 [Coffea eugenioides]|uniref:ataxin-10 n=1 Tax=Coffea eugenioides TaxID=49369 RepID=UPI000F61177D|nr:ataxin-10 [Coffea eugenioides]